ncbi:MAG: pyridoxamine 5-phosphate oxidase-related FMN-binding [Frankiales bacterium]|nr:pyridoxamine 5-phosphate oxidase-related FMN-binding [Frankiales bacterium]
MADLDDPGVTRLLTEPHYAVVSTLNEDGSIHSTIVWVDVLDGNVAVNSAVGRKWPTNLEHNPTITVLVYDESNPYDYLEVRGTAKGTTEGADDHIDQLSKKYTGKDTYPFRQPGEQRISFRVHPTLIRHQTPA